jgi:glutaconate CoA-transferase subunit B
MVGGKFAEKLDYMTSPGWLTGGDSRRKAGIPGGPSALINKYGVFRFEDITKEIYLDALFPQTTVDDVRKLVPWELKTAEDFGKEIKKVALPEIEQIEYIREFEPFFGISGNLGRRLQSQVLPVYYEQGNTPHE